MAVLCSTCSRKLSGIFSSSGWVYMCQNCKKVYCHNCAGSAMKRGRKCAQCGEKMIKTSSIKGLPWEGEQKQAAPIPAAAPQIVIIPGQQAPRTGGFCPDCGNKLGQNAVCPQCSKFCKKCGAPTQNVRYCPSCGEPQKWWVP